MGGEVKGHLDRQIPPLIGSLNSMMHSRKGRGHRFD